MNILQQPDALSFSLNLKELRIVSFTRISLVLKQGDEVILSQGYEPSTNGIVVINLRDIIHSRLSYRISDLQEVHPQPLLSSLFTAVINDTPVSFQVVRGGVDRLEESVSNFLTQNFLTWQPTVKPVTYYSPEFLTYYCVVDARVHIRACFPDGEESAEEKILAELVSGKAYTIPLQYAYVSGLFGGRLPAYYDVWIENAESERLTYIQRYHADAMRSEQEQWILFENSLGGLDTFRAYGTMIFNGEHTHNLAEIEEVAHEYRVDTERKYKKNTGHLTVAERRWLLDFFPSTAKYVYLSNYLRRIVLTESEVEYTDKEFLSSFSFTYKFADARPLLNLPRADVPAQMLSIKVPDAGSFTVPPRLAEFPRLPLTEGALFPVQNPYSQTWSVTSASELSRLFAGWLSEYAGGSGQVGHEHHNFELLHLLSMIDGYLLLGEERFKAGYADVAGEVEGDKYLRKDTPDSTSSHLGLQGGSTVDKSLLVRGSLAEESEDVLTEDLPGALLEESPVAETGTLGSLADVDDAADAAPKGSLLQRTESGWEAVAPVAYGGEATPDMLTPVYDPRRGGYVFFPASNPAERFSEVLPQNDTVSIDHRLSPYSKVTLSGETSIFHLEIRGTSDGDSGRILLFQTGGKQLTLGDGVKGSVHLPVNPDTVALLSYRHVGDTLYMYSQTVLGDVLFPNPRKVEDFTAVYSDAVSCRVRWSAPYANHPADRVTSYDIRYAHAPVNADDPAVWAGLKRLEDIPLPLAPGGEHELGIPRLAPGMDYYFYLKSVKVNLGVSYLSEASAPVHVRTLGSSDTSKAYRISLTPENIMAQNSVECGALIDEQSSNVYTQDGYLDESHKNYQTGFIKGQYTRGGQPYNIFIDLFAPYALDRLYLFAKKIGLTVYTLREIGYNWERAGEISIDWNTHARLHFEGRVARFIRLSFDRMDVGRLSFPGKPEGYEGKLLFADFNETVDPIYNVVLYGRPLSSTPEGIREPMRNAAPLRPVEEFFCTNGQLYHQGRIQSMCSGRNVRLFVSQGWFTGTDGWGESVASTKFTVDRCGWVSANNGTGQELEEHLRDTYRRYGLKPFLTFKSSDTAPLKYDNSNHWRPLDSYYLPVPWKPLPKKGQGGLTDYFRHTFDPGEYRIFSRLVYALAAKYGSNPDIPDTSMIRRADTNTLGTGLISGIEWGNEPDGDWEGFHHFHQPEEVAAMASAAADGNGGTLTDEHGGKSFGVKRADPSLLAIHPGYAGIRPGTWESEILFWNAVRPAGGVPVDVLNVHQYIASTGNQHNGDNSAVQYALPLDYEMEVNGNTERGFQKMVELRNRLAPGKELWITELGYGESGGRNSQSALQCFSLPGRYVGDWLIPDRHRSEVKGAYIVRATLYLMHMGFNQFNYYSTECEADFFDTGRYGHGAGTEMWHWEECTDETPGARYAAVEPYEVAFNRGGFAAMGLFGNILSNGGYPISRAYWYVATMRHRLKGYVFTGRKYLANSRVMVFCFKKQGEEKGAYAVWYNDRVNAGVRDVCIPLPQGVRQVIRVTNFIPSIPNPETVPADLGNNEERTGLPAARHERYENGAWVIKTRGSRAAGAALYPEAPEEGDEVVVLPTPEENPYFPIVGPVGARLSGGGHKLAAQQYEVYNTQTGVYESRYAIHNAWRQVEACCDFIEHTPQGQHGVRGDEQLLHVLRDELVVNVCEVPEYYFFDAAPSPDYRSAVGQLSSRAVDSSSVELWWNNTSTEDTAYEVFISDLPETGYTLFKTVPAGIENKAVISGLEPATVKYFRVRPLKGEQTGMMSGYTAAKTHSEVPQVENLRLASRTATSLTLAWDYPQGTDDFHHYAVYRADASEVYSLYATLEDVAERTFTDTQLTPGALYRYKLRVVGLNGQSGYSEVLETRTLLPQECPPSPQYALTDKLGLRVSVVFDLPLLPAVNPSDFTLTEEGSARLILSAGVDENNPRVLVLRIPEGSLQEYAARTDIRLSYTGTGLASAYNVPALAFEALRVGNVIGNFTGLEALYKVNFTYPSEPTPHEGWNNLMNPNYEGQGYGVPLTLTDTYGRVSSIKIECVQSGSKIKFQGARNNYAWSGLGIAPDEVTRTTWDLLPGTEDDSHAGRLRLTGLNDERRYTLKLFSSATRFPDYTLQLRVGDTRSNVLGIHENTAGFATLEDCRSQGGMFEVDILSKTTGKSSFFSFLLIEEYKSSDEPESEDVYLRALTIEEADEQGVVKTESVHLRMNVIGRATQARAAQSQEELEGAGWTPLGDDRILGYTLQGGYGEKTLYVQVRNLSAVSNVRTVSLIHRDPYVPLSLGNIYINGNADECTAREVDVFFEVSGVPTHYKLSEDSSFADASWTEWTEGASKPFTLSGQTGIKTLYGQLKGVDKSGEPVLSGIKADTVVYREFVPLSIAMLTINSVPIEDGCPTTSSGVVTVGFNVLGSDAPTHYRITESGDVTLLPWLPYEQSVSFTLSEGVGSKSIYVQVRNAQEESNIASGSVIRVAFVRKLTLAFGWHWKNSDDGGVTYRYNAYDEELNINRVKIGTSLNERQPVRWNDKSQAGHFSCGSAYQFSVNNNLAANGNQGAVSGNNSGEYPDEYLMRNSYDRTYWGNGTWLAKLEIPSGTYRMRLFASTMATNNNSSGKQARYEVVTGLGTEQEAAYEFTQPEGYDFRGNTSQWLEQTLALPEEIHIRVVGLGTAQYAVHPINIMELIPQ